MDIVVIIYNNLSGLTIGDFCDIILMKLMEYNTIAWYLDNKEWWETIISGEYQDYYDKMYGNR